MLTEVWRPVAGFPGYDVSSAGRVRSWWSDARHCGNCAACWSTDRTVIFVMH